MLVGFGFNGFNQLIDEGKPDVAVVKPVEIPWEESVRVLCVHCSWARIFIAKQKGNNGYEFSVSHTGDYSEAYLKACEKAGCPVIGVASSWDKTHFLALDGRIISGENVYSNPESRYVVLAAGEGHCVAITESLRAHVLWSVEEGIPRCPLPSVPVMAVSCGKRHVLMMSQIGEVFSLGDGSRGQLGHGTTDNLKEAQRIEALAGVRFVKVAAGGWHSLALSDIGDIYAWGWNVDGQLGLPSQAVQEKKQENCCAQCKGPQPEPQTPEQIRAAEDVMTSSSGDVVAQSEDTFVNFQVVPTVLELECEDDEEVNFVSISCGTRHSAAVTGTGEVYTFGWNGYGQLGLGHQQSQDEPQKVTSLETYKPKNPVRVHCGAWNTVVELA